MIVQILLNLALFGIIKSLPGIFFENTITRTIALIPAAIQATIIIVMLVLVISVLPIPAQYADALAGAIRKLVDDPALRLSMGAAARDRVAEIGLWEPKFERVGAIYDELIESRRSPKR